MIRAGIRRFFHLALRRRDRWEAEVEAEIKLHLALRAEQLVADGRSADEAYAEAVRRFGPLTESRSRLFAAARHREQNMQRTEFFDDLRQDLSFAIRTLARQKAWALVTIATLALGIAATTAVFSVVSTILLHAVPYPHADRVVYVTQQPSEGNHTGIPISITPSAKIVRAWKRDSRSFEAIEGTSSTPRLLKTVSSEPSVVNTFSFFPTFLEFAGIRPIKGRFFTMNDIESGARVVALGESFWRNRLGADPNVIGQIMTLNDTSYMVVGVLPSTMRFSTGSTTSIDVMVPLDVRNDSLAMEVWGRLRPGISPAAAQTELDSITMRSSGFTAAQAPFRAIVVPPAARVQYHDSLIMLAGAVALVLLVACANVAHLLLVRSATRQRELAIRTALGAGRGRLVRQLLTESLILTVGGAALGVFGGWAGLRTMIALRPRSLDSLVNAHLDVTTVALAVAVAVVSAILFTLIGLIHARRHATHDALKSGSLGAGSSRRAGLGRSILMVSEMALSATLLVGATLVVRSVVGMQHADLGYKPDGLYIIDPLPRSHGLATGSRFGSEPARAAALREFMSRLRAIPSVHAATMAAVEPGSRNLAVGRLEIEGEPPPPPTSTSFTDWNAIQQNFFTTMGIHLLNGTIFTDTTETSKQVIVNEGFVRKHWPTGAAAIGHRVRVAESDSTPWSTIVGVVNDVQTTGADVEATAPIFYSPMSKVGTSPHVLVRVAGPASTLAPALTALKDMGMTRVMPPTSVAEMMARLIAAPRFVMTILTVLTLLALILAAVGLYGMMTYAVAQQTREIGIRVALGASGEHIARSVIGRGAALAIVGAVIGLSAATWGTRVIESQLYGVTRLDPVSFAIGAVVLVGAALAACVVPTRRALAIDPMTAIRAE